MSNFVSWTDIALFSSLMKTITAYPHHLGGEAKIVYRAKVKLHGSCAGIRIDPDGTVTAFSRGAILTEKEDLKGFCKWVMAEKAKWSALSANLPSGESLVIFGEWCGPGVIKGATAISKTEKKCFAIFGARLFDQNAKTETAPEEPEVGRILMNPEDLEAFKVVPDAYVLPWFKVGGLLQLYPVHFTDLEATQKTLDLLNQHVLDVEANDPWVEATFGVKGGGEGLVLYPALPYLSPRDPKAESAKDYNQFSNLVFKAKGEKHQVIEKAKPAQIAPETAESAKAFAAMVLPEARLEQGAQVVSQGGVNFSMTFLGPFLAWIKTDILKECRNEMEASNLDEKLALRECETFARTWYIGKAKGI